MSSLKKQTNKTIKRKFMMAEGKQLGFIEQLLRT